MRTVERDFPLAKRTFVIAQIVMTCERAATFEPSGSASRMVEPVSGWALNYLVTLDLHSPGLVGAFLRASDERRQVCAALMATKAIPSEHPERAKLADLLSSGRHQDILSAAYRNVPNGIRGALARSGPQPHAPAFYRALCEILLSPSYGKTAVVIQQLDHLDLMRLRIALRLPADICTPSVVKLIGSTRMAADVTKFVELLSNNGVTRTGLAEAIRRVSTHDQLASLWDRWSEKLGFPPNPLPACDIYTPINTGAELRRLSVRYRNCARRYIAQVMVGETAFGEFHGSGKRVVLLLACSNGSWMLDAVFGKDNSIPRPEIRSAAEHFCRKYGVRISHRSQEVASEWAVLRRLSRDHSFGY